MSEKESERLRYLLASVGITLDEPKQARPNVVVPTGKPPVDKGRIRSILIERGAPEDQLWWLVRSCPSESDAMTYNPPSVAGRAREEDESGEESGEDSGGPPPLEP